MGALFTFTPNPNGGPTTILARVGVSFISSAQACQNAQEEIPDFNFDSVHAANRAQWNDLLGRIQVDTTNVNLETTQLFYSSVSLSFSLSISVLVNSPPCHFSSTELISHLRIVCPRFHFP